MATITRGDRMVRIFAFLMAHHYNRYSVTEIMHHLNIPQDDLRSVQRDLKDLVEQPKPYIQRITEGSKVFFQVNLPKASPLVFPEFGDTLLHLVFLQRIANLYPAVSSTIGNLIQTIQDSLPIKDKEQLSLCAKELDNHILFMGTPPSFEDSTNKVLQTLLRAIQERRKVKLDYTDNFGKKTSSTRVPLLLVIYQGEIYVGCVSQHNPGKTYALKMRRIESARLTQEQFTEDPQLMEALRKRVNTGAFLIGDQSPKTKRVVIKFPGYARFFLQEEPFHRSMKITSTKDGNITATMNVEVNEMLTQWVLHFGSVAQVLEPQELKNNVLSYAKELVEMYSSS